MDEKDKIICELRNYQDFLKQQIIEWKSMYSEQKDLSIEFRNLWQQEKNKVKK